MAASAVGRHAQKVLLHQAVEEQRFSLTAFDLRHGLGLHRGPGQVQYVTKLETARAIQIVL